MIAESHTPEVLIRKLLDGVLDLAFMLEPAQLDVLQIREVATVELILVSDREDTSLDEALGDGYLMVDWGLAHALMHRRMFPDAPEPHTRLGNSHMALSYLHALGGGVSAAQHAARTPGCGVAAPGEWRPVIRHAAHAVFRLRGPRQDLIDDVLGLFHDRG